jgi:uncharacterized small protein (DUF1192 family)
VKSAENVQRGKRRAMSEIQRYDWNTGAKSPTGEHVMHSDYLAALRERDERIAELGDEIARGSGRRKHTHEWYEKHYGKLHDWARKILPEPYRKQFFSCIANGLYSHDDIGKPYKCMAGFMVTPSGYFQMETAQEQILFDQCVRAEDAEAENAALRQRVEARTNERNVAMEVLTRIGTPENIHEATSAILAARKEQGK